MLDTIVAAASASSAAPTAVVVATPSAAGSQLTVVLALLALFLIYFGPSLLRVVLKPEKGSKLDLRIAWFETFVSDVEKRTKITEKLAKLARLPGADLLPPPPSPDEKKDTDRDTTPPAVKVPDARSTDDVLTAEVPAAPDTQRGYDSIPPEKEEP